MTPDFTPEQLATLQRIEAADPAPESYIGSDGLTNDERRKWMPRIGNGLRPAADRKEMVEYLQDRRIKSLRALRACTNADSTDYWRWQGHAELSRQVLELMGEEVPS